MLLTILLWLTVFFDGVPARCLVDTGANITLLSQTNAARMGTLSASHGHVMLRTVTGQTVVGTRHAIPHVGTARIGWGDGEVVVLPDKVFPWGCLLGTDFLSRQSIVIDWSNGELYAATSAEGSTGERAG